jgi:hypothetical protein
MRILGIVALGAALVPVGALGQINDDVAAVAGPWHHVPSAVSAQQFNRDAAKCRVIAAQTPISSTTPAVIERVISNVIVNCLKASGYEPGAANSPTVAKPSSAMKPALADRDAAGGGVGIYPCAEFTKLREKPDFEALFFTWAQGFLTGWNMGVPNDTGLSVELSKLSRDEQKQFIREYCEANPTKRYLQGVIALMAKLK